MERIGLFDFSAGTPLAARVRPRKFADVRGHELVLGTSSLLKSFETGELVVPSLILYGPPGTGKTTLARILAESSNRRFIELSAVNSSLSELRAAFSISMEEIAQGRSAAVVFIDEIHRFSKVQQDALLKQVEDGTIVLIGATTENPRFSVTPALTSRSMLVALEPLKVNSLVDILTQALLDERGLDGKFKATEDVLVQIARLSGGDARKALTILETASVSALLDHRSDLLAEDVSNNLQTAFVRYDSDGDQHYDVISAYIKAIRGSGVDEALHYLARMLHGGEDPRFIARRLVILAAEDVGLADPHAITLANTVLDVVANIGMPEARIPLAQGTIYLALAPKSNSAYQAINQALEQVSSGFAPEIPSYLRSSPLQSSTETYIYPHDIGHKVSNQALTSEPVGPLYIPGNLGFESQLAERMRLIDQILGKSKD